MPATILAVSEDEAFATMLKEGLEGLGTYQVVLAHSADDARRAAESGPIDLLIVDIDLEQIRPVDLVADIRGTRPETHLMWMAFMGQDLPVELTAVDAHGTLTKPFFIDDLRQQIEAALPEEARMPLSPTWQSKTAERDETPSTGATTRPQQTRIVLAPDTAISRRVQPTADGRRASRVDIAPAAAENQSPGGPNASAAGGSASSAPSNEERPVAGGDVVTPPRRVVLSSMTATRRDPERSSPPSRPARSPAQQTGGGGIVLGTDRASRKGSQGAGSRRPGASELQASDPRAQAKTEVTALEVRLRTLAQDLNAEAVLLLGPDGSLAAAAGLGPQSRFQELAAAIAVQLAAAGRVAALLGKADHCLTQIQEGVDFLLFTHFMQDSNFVLSVAVRTDVPLGTVRYEVRQAAAELSRHVGK